MQHQSLSVKTISIGSQTAAASHLGHKSSAHVARSGRLRTDLGIWNWKGLLVAKTSLFKTGNARLIDFLCKYEIDPGYEVDNSILSHIRFWYLRFRWQNFKSFPTIKKIKYISKPCSGNIVSNLGKAIVYYRVGTWNFYTTLNIHNFSTNLNFAANQLLEFSAECLEQLL